MSIAQQPDEIELERRMCPGALSQTGFLARGEHLAGVLAQDAATLAKLGVTAEQLADALDRLVEAAEHARPRRVVVDGRFEVEMRAYLGFQMCPWSPDPDHMQCEAGGGVQHGSVDWTIHNLATDQTMRGPGIIIHLMRAHHFFEGPGVPSRVDPQALARLLQLGPFAERSDP